MVKTGCASKPEAGGCSATNGGITLSGATTGSIIMMWVLLASPYLLCISSAPSGTHNETPSFKFI